MANKKITDLTQVAEVLSPDEFEVQKSGETTTKKCTLTQLTFVEAGARDAADSAIKTGAGLETNGTYGALTNSWYLRSADFTAGGIDRGGSTGAITPNIKNGLRLLDMEIKNLADTISGTSEIIASTITVSAAEMLSLNTVPKVLITVATGYVAEVISVAAYLEYNSTTYESGTNPLVVRYAGGSTLFEFPNSFVEATTNVTYRGAYTANQVMTGGNVQLYCASNPTTGNSEVQIWIMYRLHTVATA